MVKRLLFFAYGVAAYLIFLATFLYAIAFVGGFAVPTRLDGPLQTSLLSALAIDAALLVPGMAWPLLARRVRLAEVVCKGGEANAPRARETG